MISLANKQQNTSYQSERSSHDQSEITRGVFRGKFNWVSGSGVFKYSNASYRSGSSRITFGEISRTQRGSGLQAQALELFGANVLVFKCAFSLPSSSSWSRPDANFSIADLKAQSESSVKLLDLIPAVREALGGVNDRKTFIEEDHLRFGEYQIPNNYQSSANRSKFEDGLQAAGVPSADIDSQNEKSQNSEGHQIGYWTENSWVARVDHVAIVAQKVRN